MSKHPVMVIDDWIPLPQSVVNTLNLPYGARVTVELIETDGRWLLLVEPVETSAKASAK